MMIHTPELSNLFSLSGLIAFIAGMGTTRAAYWVRDRWEDHRHPNQPHHVHKWKSIVMAWSVLVAAMLYIIGQTHQATMMTEQTNADVRHLATKTRDCQATIIGALRARAILSDANDALTEQMRNLLAEGNKELDTWISGLVNPPTAIAALPIGDLQRQQYGLDITTAYFARSDDIDKQISVLQARVKTIQEERAKHPIAAPQC